jgi:diketogulonate reductase-like aldo/keto reductase
MRKLMIDKKPIGKTNEYVSSLGLGTWSIRDYGRAKEAFIYALNNWIDNVDTAEMYDNGEAERFIGEVIRSVGKEKVFVTTKMLPYHLESRDSALKAARASLNRLGLRSVDLFLIHWPSHKHSIEHQIKVFESLVTEGLARYIGVSNFTRSQLEEAIQAPRSTEIVVNQVHYSVLHKHVVESELLPFCLENRITIQAYTPLERGEVARHPVIMQISRRINKTPVQVALNYLISKPNVIAIPKTESLEHVKEIIGAMGWRLPRDIIDELRSL